MKNSKQTFITALALFSLFFGAGNLILPPHLGFKSGEFWSLVTLGFCISAVLIPILGILAHARLQGSMFNFAEKVSPRFSLIYCFIIYSISIALPSPRTASVTHEMAIAPFFNSSSVLTSILYFVLVYIFVINRSKILDIIGKFLTPAILIILLLIIGISIYSFDFVFGPSTITEPISHGILEGYQTFDAIGAVVVGGVIIISLNLKNTSATYQEKRTIISRAGWLAGLALLLMYAGLILTGAFFQNEFSSDMNRTGLLTGIGLATLGKTTNLFLSILIGLACFTTAVGIVTGTADFMKSRFNNTNSAYRITALIACVLGVLMGQFDVGYIIAVALPALMFVYPITIILIFLNVLPERYTSKTVFRLVIFTTIIFSIPDFLNSLGLGNYLNSITNYIPLSGVSMGWVLPAVVVFLIANIISLNKK